MAPSMQPPLGSPSFTSAGSREFVDYEGKTRLQAVPEDPKAEVPTVGQGQSYM
jgi:hypothetical protein